jgi:hypothetical protein
MVAVSSNNIQVIVLAANSNALLGVGDALELRFVVAEEDIFELELEKVDGGMVDEEELIQWKSRKGSSLL